MVLTMKQRNAVNRASPINRPKLIRLFNRQNGNANGGNNRSRVNNNNRQFRRNTGFRGRFRLNGNRRYFSQIGPQSTFSNRMNTTIFSAPNSVGFNVSNAQRTNYTVTRTSFIADLYSNNNGDNVDTMTLHPSVFPWLGTIAKSFDKYKFLSLAVRLVPNVSTGKSGAMYTAFNYEDHNPNVTSMLQAQSLDKFTCGPVWNSTDWISVPSYILRDKWYDVTIARNDDGEIADNFHDYASSRLVVGVSGTDVAVGNLIARVECRVIITFSRPSLDTRAPGNDGGGNPPGRQPELLRPYCQLGNKNAEDEDVVEEVDSLTDMVNELNI